MISSPHSDKPVILIFETSVAGHHLEYINHYYHYASSDPCSDYVFLMPKSFSELKSKFLWPQTDNVRFECIDEDDRQIMTKGNLVIGSFYKCRYLNVQCHKYKAKMIITTMLMEYFPALPFILDKDIEFKGVLYRNPFRERRTMSYFKRIVHVVRFWQLVCSPQLKRIFLLNDAKYVGILNKRFGTTKFVLLPDPIPTMPVGVDIRNELTIPQANTVYLHMGGMGMRKGTIRILESLKSISCTSNKTFFFAGKVGDDCRDQFYRLVEELKDKTQIIVFDKFCEFELFSSLCRLSDCILIPYTNTNQSSGVLGYAAKFRIPVIGPNEGLLGEIISKYNLGIMVDTSEVSSISCGIDIIRDKNSFRKQHCCFDEYVAENSIDNFVNVIMR